MRIISRKLVPVQEPSQISQIFDILVKAGFPSALRDDVVTVSFGAHLKSNSAALCEITVLKKPLVSHVQPDGSLSYDANIHTILLTK